jgi:hypothetical protein
VGSSPTFPTRMVQQAGVVQLAERLLAKEKVVGSNPIARFSLCNVSGSGPGFLVILRGTALRCHPKLQEVVRFSCK